MIVLWPFRGRVMENCFRHGALQQTSRHSPMRGLDGRKPISSARRMSSVT